MAFVLFIMKLLRSAFEGCLHNYGINKNSFSKTSNWGLIKFCRIFSADRRMAEELLKQLCKAEAVEAGTS